MAEKIYNDINGVIILDKPKDFTSNDCISVIKKILHPKKIGHTGTLDVNATGVLVCLLGDATKCQDFLMKDGLKTYDAELVLGISTDTEDYTGTIKEHINTLDRIPPDDRINDAINSFKRVYYQIPPMYSAKKIDGKKLIDIARKGKEIDRKSCRVEIKDITDIGYKRAISYYSYSNILSTKDPTGFSEAAGVAVIYGMKVTCTKGTYIRTLCKDIGVRMDVPSCMGELRRLSSGTFDIKDSITLDDLKKKVEANDLSFIKPCYYMEKNSVVTFGKYETLHIGHQSIIKKVVDEARKKRIESTVLIIGRMTDNEVISSAQRMSKLKLMGVDNVIEFPLTDENMHMEARDFVNDILIKQLKAKTIIVGSDCSFGSGAAGDIKLLGELAAENGIKAVVVDKLKCEETGTDVSSTLIRKLHSKKNVALVDKLMGKASKKG